MVDSPKAPWWRDAVVYEVYPRSFADGNGDGEGDLCPVGVLVQGSRHSTTSTSFQKAT